MSADIEAARLAGESDAYGKVACLVQELAREHRADPGDGYARALDDVGTGLLRLLGAKPLDELETQLAGTVP